MDKLANEVLAILDSSEEPLLVRDIAEELTRRLGQVVERREVNRCLYGADLRGRVQQDRRYRWSRASRAVQGVGRSAGIPLPDEPGPQDWIGRLLAYYRQCIVEDEGNGARVFLTDEGNRFLDLRLEREWGLHDSKELVIELGGGISRFAAQLRQQGVGQLLYGYPLFVEWIPRSASGWSGGFALPAFLQPVEYELVGSSLRIELVPDWPRANPEFLSRVAPTAEERKCFLQELGLLEVDDDPPEDGLADVIRRLAAIGPPIDFVEEPDPEALAAAPPLAALREGGLYNRAVLVLGERPTYTKGLEGELRELMKPSARGAMSKSSLRLFFEEREATAKPAPSGNEPVVEVVPLNDEQRAAVRAAFEQELTVVTGPPGTGKSQIVLTVLANAFLRGERVLFTSRNNKAVDVVESRLKALSGFPITIRAGTRSGDRDLRRELIEFLSQVLSIQPSDDRRRAVAAARGRVEEHAAARERLWDDLERLRQQRNRVDELDRHLEDVRTTVPDAVWDLLVQLRSLPSRVGLEAALALLRAQSGGGLRPALRRKRDFALVESTIAGLAAWGPAFEGPDGRLTKDAISDWERTLGEVLRRLGIAEAISAYDEAVTALLGLASPEAVASTLARTDDELWEASACLIAAHGRLLPDRLDGDLRRTLGEYRATIERLAEDRLGGRAYASLRRDQEQLFSKVTQVLPVWCLTNLSARGSLPFESALFDLVVIDEGSQCDIPSALPLLFRAQRALIIGDPQQLRHIATLNEQRDQQLQVRHGLVRAADQPFGFSRNSLFDLAATVSGQGALISLKEHFRSHADIVAFSNERWYRGSLEVCTDYRRLRSPEGSGPAVIWTHRAGNVVRPRGGGALNETEATAVVDELVSLLDDRRFPGSVGVVTPFRAQAIRIRDLVSQRLDLSTIERSGLVVDTAHGFQGDERDVILFSPCVSEGLPRGARYFLSTTGNLFNVAITRARSLLHVVGDQDACAACGVDHIEAFARYVAALDLGRSPDSLEDVDAVYSRPDVSGWERRLYEALKGAGLDPIPQYQEHQYRLDLALLRDAFKLDVEVDGEHFHKEWDGSQSRRDVIRDLRLAGLGWHVKRFWVYQIRDDLEQCVREIVELMGSGGRPASRTSAPGAESKHQ